MGEVVRMRGADNSMSVGGPVDEAEPTLCVYGDDLDPDDVTRLLGSPPSRSHRKGDILGAMGSLARTGAWLLESPGQQSGELESRIHELLSRVTTDREAWHQLSQRHSIRMSCMLTLREWSRGLSLSADLLGTLASRGIQLDLSIYYVGDGDA
jgi:hypothetical protein